MHEYWDGVCFVHLRATEFAAPARKEHKGSAYTWPALGWRQGRKPSELYLKQVDMLIAPRPCHACCTGLALCGLPVKKATQS